VNRKSIFAYLTVQPSALYIYLIPSNYSLQKKSTSGIGISYSRQWSVAISYIVHYAHVMHMQITCYYLHKGRSRKSLHRVCHVINFEPFVLGLPCLHKNAHQRLMLAD